ncbi:MAG: BspA family leucine-rich repeat surface protein [Coriobacteriia bacterium]|nr:BspA family leucine-rich repeat surface protein [Coriobacteriia bacterium]
MTGLTSVDGFENIADRKVECMNAMFLHSCGVNCETIDISKLKPNYYIDADSMFEGCKTKYINFIPFSGSEPYQLQSTYSMFKDCENLKDIFCEGGIYAQPKQNYKVDSMFENCKELTSININQIYINSTHTIKNMFKGCFNLCGVNTTTEVKNWTDISAENSVDMFEGCEKLPNYGSSIAGQRNSQYAKSDLEGGFFTKIPEHEGRAIILGNTLTFFTEQDSSITDYYKVPVNLKNEDAPWASKAETINDISYTNNFKSWFSNVQSLHAWFKNTKVTDSVVSKLVDLNTTNIKDMSSLFYGCTETHIPDFSNLQTTSLVDISYMFSNSSLGSPQGTGTAYTCNLKTNNVKYMSNVFSGCSQLLKYNNLILSENFATSNVVDMSGMFDQCNSQSYKVQFSNSFNTSNVKDFSYMFSNCSWISKSIDQVSIMDTSNAIDMSYMFSVSNIAGEFSLENAT